MNKSEFSPLILPLSPTDNRLKMPVIRNRKPFLIKTTEYRDWDKKAAIEWELWQRQNPTFKPHEPSQSSQMQFNYSLFLPDWRTDISNYGKALSDFLGGNKKIARLFTDDHYVYLCLTLPVTVDKLNPRVEINVCAAK